DTAAAAAIASSGDAPEVRQDDKTDHECPEDDRQRIATRMLPLLLRLFGSRDILLRFFGRQAHLLDDLTRSGLDPAAIIWWRLFEVRKDGFANDHSRHGVGEESACAVAGRNPYFTL